MRAFASGVAYPARAFWLLARRPRLWLYVLAPIALNVLVGITLYVGLLVAGLRAIDRLVAGLPGWAAVIGDVLRILLVVALLLVTGFVLLRVGVVLGKPWYATLSARIEHIHTGRPAPDEPSGLVGELWRGLMAEVQKLLLVAGVGATLLVVSLLPPVGPMAGAVGSITLGATLASLDFLEAPFERRRIPFRARLAFLRRSLPASAGFGLACLWLVSVPVVNLLTIPVCVAAGTLFFCDRAPRQAQAPEQPGRGTALPGSPSGSRAPRPRARTGPHR